MNNYRHSPLSIWVDNQRRLQRNGPSSSGTILEQKLQLILIGISDKLEVLSERHPDAEREIAEIIDDFGVLSFQISGTDIKQLYGEGSGSANKR
jgi:hypothetical protein